jgi:hypothetical protein
MTQTAQILNYLLTGESLTPLDALQRFHCFRLGARIFELRQQGEPIKSELVEVNGKHVSRYSWDWDEERCPYG